MSDAEHPADFLSPAAAPAAPPPPAAAPTALAITPTQENIHLPSDYRTALEAISGKPTNPKDAVGIRKVPMSCVPSGPLAEVALGMMEGALKYGRHNYRVAGVRASVYYDASMRHLMQWWEGEDTDADSGANHITKLITSLFVLRDSMLRGNWVDDRPPHMEAGWMAPLNDAASALIDKYPPSSSALPYLDKPV